MLMSMSLDCKNLKRYEHYQIEREDHGNELVPEEAVVDL